MSLFMSLLPRDDGFYMGRHQSSSYYELLRFYKIPQVVTHARVEVEYPESSRAYTERETSEMLDIYARNQFLTQGNYEVTLEYLEDIQRAIWIIKFVHKKVTLLLTQKLTYYGSFPNDTPEELVLNRENNSPRGMASGWINFTFKPFRNGLIQLPRGNQSMY